MKSFVLLSTQPGFLDAKFLRQVENLAIRRVHAFTPTNCAVFLKSYALLRSPGTPKSATLVKTLQSVCKAKIDEFSAKEALMCASALIRFDLYGMEIADSPVNSLLEHAQLEIEDGASVEASVLAESISLQAKWQQQSAMAFWTKQVQEHPGLKPKDVFQLAAVDELKDWLLQWILSNFDQLLPEEICLALKMHPGSEELREQAYQQALSAEMSTDESLALLVLLNKPRELSLQKLSCSQLAQYLCMPVEITDFGLLRSQTLKCL